MKKLRVGILGLGVGEHHLKAYLKLPACEVTLLCDKDPNKLKAIRKRYPKIAQTTRAQDVLKNPAIDVVSIATYDHMHAQQVITALRNKKHVFVEKPLCRTPQELVAIAKIWMRQGGKLRLASNLVLRAAPVYVWLKEQIRLGRMGTVYAIDGEYLYGRLEKVTEGWRKNVPDYSVLQGGGIHMLDLMLWLTGQRPKTVWAQGNRLSTWGTAFRYKDFVTATLEFPSTLIGRLTANFGCVHEHQHVLRVFGTKATFLLDDQGPRWITSRKPGQPAKHVLQPILPRTKGALIPTFIKSIRRANSARKDTETLFDMMGTLNACERSLQSGRRERV